MKEITGMLNTLNNRFDYKFNINMNQNLIGLHKNYYLGPYKLYTKLIQVRRL